MKQVHVHVSVRIQPVDVCYICVYIQVCILDERWQVETVGSL